MSNTAATPLLSVQDLHVHYGKSHILHGVTFEVQEGEVVSLLGRNGSGRSTTTKSIMGLVPPTSGQIRFGGRDIAGTPPYAVARAGVAYVPEEREAFANLSVDENLIMGMQEARDGAPAWTIEEMFDYFPRLKERSEEHTSELQSLMRISYAVFCLKKKKQKSA